MRYGAVGLLDSQTCSNVFFGVQTPQLMIMRIHVGESKGICSTAYNPLWLVLCTLLFAKSAVLLVEQ